MDVETIALCESSISDQGVSLVEAVLESGRWGDGPMLESFEQGFARWVGRRYAVAVGSGTLGTWIALRAMGIGPGDEVVCASHTWHQVAQAITLAGATPVFADINYWSGCLSAEKAALKITPATKAILAGNTNGHPAAWKALRSPPRLAARMPAIHRVRSGSTRSVFQASNSPPTTNCNR